MTSVCSEKTVHRYHAVIRRTTDGDVVITDLSGADGNGVLINGKRIGEARLVKGDVIGIGEVKLKFDAQARLAMDAATLDMRLRQIWRALSSIMLGERICRKSAKA